MEILNEYVTYGVLLAMIIGGFTGVILLQGIIKLIDFLIKKSESKKKNSSSN